MRVEHVEAGEFPAGIDQGAESSGEGCHREGCGEVELSVMKLEERIAPKKKGPYRGRTSPLTSHQKEAGQIFLAHIGELRPCGGDWIAREGDPVLP